jgi:hypothetical protein
MKKQKTIKELNEKFLFSVSRVIVFIIVSLFVIKLISSDIKYTITYSEWFFDDNAKEWRIVKDDNKYYPQYRGINFGFIPTKDGFFYVESRGDEPDPLYLGFSPLSFRDSLSAVKWIEGI